MRSSVKTIGTIILGVSANVMAMCAAVPVARSEEQLGRGAELVRHVAACGQCHTPRTAEGAPIATLDLAGGAAKQLPLGDIAAPNITPDVETGIGSWSEQEIVTALRMGTRPDGTIIGPPMPIALYRSLADADAIAIAKYLKSVPAIRRVVPKSVYKVPLPTSYASAASSAPASPPSDRVAYGSYLAGIAHCLLCHTPLAGGRMDASRLGAGGRQYLDDEGHIVVSANITPDKTDGIGSWGDQDVKQAITQGVNPYGGQLNSFMPSAYFSGMAPDNLDAIVTYLHTLKPLPSN